MENFQLQPWKTLATRDVHNGEPWLKLSIEQVQLPNGHIVDDYYRLALQDYAIIFAQVPDGRVIMLRQYKHGVGRASLMLPGGGLSPGEPAIAAAQRELLEETGYQAESWRSLGQFVTSANYRGSEGHIFIAENARKVTEPNSGDLEEMEVVLLPPTEIYQAFQQGEIVVVGALAAIALALNPHFHAPH